MKKRKLAALLMAGAMLVGALAGCGSDKAAGSDTPGSDTQPAAQTDTNTSADSDVINVGIYDGSYLAVSVLVAREMGYFDDEGLNINRENGAGDGTAMVSTGDLDMFTSGVNRVLTAVAEGDTSVHIVSGLMSEGCDYVALNDFPLDELTSAQDFDGLSIAACTGDPGLLWTQEFLQDAGVEANFVEFGSIAESVTAVQKGECDIGIICGASSYETLLTGSCKVLAQVVDFVGTFPCCRLQASANMVENRHDDLVKFIRAQLRGYETYRNDPDTVGKILSDISGQDASICIAKMYDSDEYDTPMTVGIDPDSDAIIGTYEKLKNLGVINKDTTYDIEPNLSITPYQEALQSLIDEDPDNALWQELMTRFEENNAIILAKS